MEPHPTLLDELAADPFADDLSKQLTTRAPRRWVNRTTVILAGLLLAVAGFVGGALIQKHYGTPTAAASNTNNTNPRAGQFGGGQFGGGQGRGNNGGGNANGNANGGGNASSGNANGGGAGGAISGTVKLVDGTTIYVETADGRTITVRTNGSTAVQVAQPGAMSDLTAGAKVTVEGQTADGTVTATKVTKG